MGAGLTNRIYSCNMHEKDILATENCAGLSRVLVYKVLTAGLKRDDCIYIFSGVYAAPTRLFRHNIHTSTLFITVNLTIVV